MLIRDVIANSNSHLKRKQNVVASLILMRSTCRRGYQLFSPLLIDTLFRPFGTTLALTFSDALPCLWKSGGMHMAQRLLSHSLWKLKLHIQCNNFVSFRLIISTLMYSPYVYINREEYASIMSWLKQFRSHVTFYIEMYRAFHHYSTPIVIRNKKFVEKEVYRGLTE